MAVFLQRLAAPLCVFSRVRALSTVAGLVGCSAAVSGVMMLVVAVVARRELAARRGRTTEEKIELSIGRLSRVVDSTGNKAVVDGEG